LNGGVDPFLKSDIFVIDIDVNKTSQLALFIAQPFFDAGIGAFQRIDERQNAFRCKRNL
jgi:hypothetical protein